MLACPAQLRVNIVDILLTSIPLDDIRLVVQPMYCKFRNSAVIYFCCDGERIDWAQLRLLVRSYFSGRSGGLYIGAGVATAWESQQIVGDCCYWFVDPCRDKFLFSLSYSHFYARSHPFGWAIGRRSECYLWLQKVQNYCIDSPADISYTSLTPV